jgi:hypothetical protein
MMNIDDTLEKNQVFKFLREIEAICKTDKIKYMDAVLYFCEQNNLEVESVAKVILDNPLLHSRIQEEAEEMNYIEKTRRLPL